MMCISARLARFAEAVRLRQPRAAETQLAVHANLLLPVARTPSLQELLCGSPPPGSICLFRPRQRGGRGSLIQ